MPLCPQMVRRNVFSYCQSLFCPFKSLNAVRSYRSPKVKGITILSSRRNVIFLVVHRSPIRSSASSITTELPRMTCICISLVSDHISSEQRTTCPILSFSPFAFSSIASSSTMFRKTYCRVSRYIFGCVAFLQHFRKECSGHITYIVSAQYANDLATAVELDKKSAIEVL